MITATIIAIALGLTPVQSGQSAQVVSGNYESMVGSYSQTVSPGGVIHVRGVHPRSGTPYQLTIDRAGYVDADLGEREVHFRATPAS